MLELLVLQSQCQCGLDMPFGSKVSLILLRPLRGLSWLVSQLGDVNLNWVFPPLQEWILLELTVMTPNVAALWRGPPQW